MFNQITAVGNLTRDIELRYTQGGSAIANVGIATSHKYSVNGEKKEEVMFIDLTFFGKSAEIANQYLRKGSKVFITGRLKLDNWVGQDGQKHSKHSVIVETMKMLDCKQDNQSSNSEANQAPSQGGYDGYGHQNQQSYQTNRPPVEYQNAQGQTYQPQRQMPPSVPEIDIDDSEIPF